MRTGPKQFKVGQKVTVISAVYKSTRVQGSHRRNDYVEKTLKGTITRVGIKYIHIDIVDDKYTRNVEFRVDTGRERAGFGRLRQFHTLDGSADFERLAKAQETLNERDIRLSAAGDRHRDPEISIEQWEALAAVAAQWSKTKTTKK